MAQTTGQGLTSELYKTIVAIVDDRVREIRVTREEFEDLKEVVRELAQAQARTEQRLDRLAEKVEELAEAQARTEKRLDSLAARVEELAEAQKRTEARVEELAEAQKRTEARVEELAEAQARTERRLDSLTVKVEELAEAQKRTEARVEELAEAQKKTEVKLATLTDEHRKTREMLGGLAHTVGYRLEDEAIWALPHLLARDFGMEIESPLVRTFLEAAPNRYVEVNIWGHGVVDGRRVAILGEAKSQLKKRDVDGFLKTMAKVREISGMEVFPVLVTYQASPKVRQAAAEKGIKVYLSYQLRIPHGSL
jgi:chemotaxis protein histidine kinase CheA